MIVDHYDMQKIEQASGKDTLTLMECAGEAVVKALLCDTQANSSILILCGKGNNGGDGLVVARLLQNRKVNVYLAENEVRTPDAKVNYERLDGHVFIKPEELDQALEECDVILDCVYGFSYHGELRDSVRPLFQKVNASGRRIISVDIVSGCEADSGYAAKDALQADLVYALDCYKPFHMLRKDHQKFRECRLLSLDLPHPEQGTFMEMDEEKFFAGFNRKTEVSYKNTFGQMMLIGGSYGMAGALCLNITGAKSMGASYIHTVLPDSIYPICAARFLTPVYHPVKADAEETIKDLMSFVKAICYGSGAASFPDKKQVLSLLLKEHACPLVLDAEALRIFAEYEGDVHSDVPLILTPHIGEFAVLSGLSISEINRDRIKTASAYAAQHHVILVLKGPHTIVASPDGRVYINQSGCQALAQAGSGDLLAGMIAAVLLHQKDAFLASCMAVWAHGAVSQPQHHAYSMQAFPLEKVPEIMDHLFRSHGF